MPERATIDEAIAQVKAGVQPPLIAIDGLPCSGKSTAAKRLVQQLGLECVYLDEFVIPEQDWPSKDNPAFPFEYIRYNEFLDTVRALSSTGQCSYYPFDWTTYSISPNKRSVRMASPVIIEGVSSLNVHVCHLYGLKIFVESDRKTILEAAIRRGHGKWDKEWRELFMPSADLYMRTDPERRADLIIPGRGMD